MKKTLIIGAGLMVLVSACKTGTDEGENIDKLLDTQSEMQEVQEQSVEKMERLKDSLDKEKKALLNEREQKDIQIREMEEDRKLLAAQLKAEQLADVAADTAILKERLDQYEDSINTLKNEVTGLDAQLDSITQSLNFYGLQESRTEETLESGINEIDQRMTSRENRKQQEIARVALLQKRVLVSDKKIEAYELEKQMYVDERDKLLRTNATEEELAPFRDKIAQMDSIIAEERANKNNLLQEIADAQAYIAETNALMEELQSQIKAEYDRKEVIETFIASEKERLRNELEEIRQTREDLLAEQENVSDKLSRTEVQIARLNRDMELIRNKEMSDILEMQAEIEQSAAELAEQEIDLLEETGGTDISMTATSDTTGLQSLVVLGSQIDSLNDLIEEEKAEIARTRKELAESRAEAAQQRAEFGRTVGVVAIVIILGAIALLALFYYLGRRSRRSR